MNAILLAAMIAANSTGAQQGSTVLYSPVRSVADQGISLRNWGSGTIAQATDELAFEGTFSLRIATRNFFQGGLIRLTQPVDVSGLYGDKNNLIRVVMNVTDSSTTFGAGRSGGAVGAGMTGPTAGAGMTGPTAGGGQGGGRPGGGAGRPPGRPPGVPRGMPPGAMGGFGGPGRAGGGMQSGQTAMRNIRLIVTTTDGKSSEAYVPITTSGAGERGWRFVAVPLQAISGFDRTNKIIREVGIAGDATAVFYVGELKVINDATPITGDVNVREMNLALGDEVELIGYGFGGSSVLKYEWDFDASDGIQPDAEGQVIRRRFRKPGKYTITLTVSDLYGLKRPYTTTINATVNP